MSEVTSEIHKRSKKRHREDESEKNERRSKKKHKKNQAEEDKTENGVIDDVPIVATVDVVKPAENLPEIDKEHKKKKKKDKHKHKDSQESQDAIEATVETTEDAAAVAAEPQAEKKKEKKDKHKHKHKHKDKHADENRKESEENETNDNNNNNANPQNEPHFQTMVDLGGSSSEDILRAFQQLDLAHLQGVLGSLDLPSMGIDLTPDEPTGTIPTTSNKIFNKTSKKKSAAVDAEPSKKVKRKHVVDLKNLVDPNAGSSHSAMLATKWMSSKELNELEQSQGLVFKKGKFSFTEDHALKTAVEQYRARNVLSEQQMADFINSKRTAEHKRFWTDVALAVPGRPVQAVYHHVKRIYNPQANQGKWIPEEDVALRRAVADLGFSWTKISQLIGRTPADCRDRWRNHAGLSQKQSGKWTLEEEEELTNIVRSLTVEKGKEMDSEILWTAVSSRMQGRRSREQCRNKWRDDLQVKTVVGDRKRRWSQSDNYILLHQMATLSVNDDSEIVWKDLMENENLKFSSPHNLQRQWKKLEESVPDYENMAYKDLLEVLLDRYGKQSASQATKKESKKEPKQKSQKKKKFPQPPEPKSAEMIEDSDEDNSDVEHKDADEQGDQQDSDEGKQDSDHEREDNDSSIEPTLESGSESEEEVEKEVEEDSD